MRRLARFMTALAILATLLTVASSPAKAQQQAGIGKWSAPLDWEYWVAARNPNNLDQLMFPDCNINPLGVVGMGNNELEFSHAAVIPKGPYAGWVLIWRLEKGTGGQPPPI